MTSGLRIVVTGLIAQHSRMGGVAWDYLNVLLGLHRMGHEVYYFEDSGQWPYNLDGGPDGTDWVVRDCTANIRYLDEVLSPFGFAHRWAYRFPIDGSWYGMTSGLRNRILQSADLLVNVSGTLEDPDRYQAIGRRVYIDTDPVFTQLQVALGDSALARRLDGHDFHFTVGECLGPPIPNTGHDWRPTKHPVVLDEWRTDILPSSVFTTVMNWTSYEPLRYEGRVFGQKDLELRRFIELPRNVDGARFEVAMARVHHSSWETEGDLLPATAAELISQNPNWKPQQLLAEFGWTVADAVERCGDYRQYREYIQRSMAEWSVAKGGYVLGNSGWFSGRSICYLAAGRPVVVQDTGFSSVVPTGKGVLAFSSLEEAEAACREVLSAYREHSSAALEIAEAYFDSAKVLGSIIAIVSGPVPPQRRVLTTYPEE